VRLLGSFETDKEVVLVLEHCAGGDLLKAMIVRGLVADEQWACVQVVAPLLRLLEKMHRLNVSHRNVNPENIFLTEHGALRLGDFGLAVDYSRELAFARVGTLDYMAPEVLHNPTTRVLESPAVTFEELAARGIAPYGPAVDVWAVGVLAYELVTGRPPFASDDAAAQAELIMNSGRICFPPGKSAVWADFVRRALTKDPQRRPSAYELLAHPFITGGVVAALRSPQGRAGDREQLLASLLRPLPLSSRPRSSLGCASIAPEPPAALWGSPLTVYCRSHSADGAALLAPQLLYTYQLPTRAFTCGAPGAAAGGGAPGAASTRRPSLGIPSRRASTASSLFADFLSTAAVGGYSSPGPSSAR